MNKDNIKVINEERLKDELTQFTLSFIQALLKTGYYAADHPASLKAKTGLYEDFVRLLGNRNEITFIKFVQPEKLDVLIEGILEEQFSLKSGMSGGMAELFIPRFIDYFVRRNLASFSIKKSIDKQTFEKFLELMSKPHIEQKGRQDAFLDELRVNGIFNVSVIFDVDLMGEIKALPWRVRLVLARFVKDIRLLPVFKSKEEVIQAKAELIKEIVMPLKDPLLLKDILFNCDLAEKLMVDAEQLDVSGIIVSAISNNLLIKVGEIIMKEYKGLEEISPDIHDEAAERKRKRYFIIMSRIAYRLIEQNDTSGDSLLEEIHRKEIVTYESLPDRIKQAIRIKEFAKTFIQNSHAYLSRILEDKPIEGQNTIADMIMLSIPELLRQNNYELVSNVAKSFQKYMASSQIIRHAITLLRSADVLNQLEQLLKFNDVYYTIAILNVFKLAGKDGIPYLINVLRHADNIVIRKETINILSGFGMEAEPAILKELIKKEQPWYLLRNIILILGEIKSRRAAELFSELWVHEHPRVREEILSSTYKIFGKDGEGIFIEALEDKDDNVKKRAIYYLGLIKSTDKNVVKELINIIQKRSIEQNEYSEALQIQAVAVLGTIGRNSKEYHDMIEQTLINIAAPEHKKLFSTKKVQMREKSDIVKIAVCNALALLDSKKAIPLLEKLSKSKNIELAKASQNAIAKISG